jgi:putative ABC transport system ATP-binding protein
VIKLERVKKCYGDQEVLKGIDLEVGRGEFISIMGSSGSGKSTLLNIIGGMDRPEEGKVIIAGEDISEYPEEKLTRYRRSQIGFIFQFFNLLPNITVFENISMPLLLNGTEDEKRVTAFIERIGLLAKKDHYPYQLSGGEQQRVAIARALVHDPGIVLADEPTGSLDSETGTMIMDLIRQFTTAGKRTMVLVTHESYIAAYAERIVRIKDGTLFT